MAESTKQAWVLQFRCPKGHSSQMPASSAGGAQGRWSPAETKMSINCLELKIIFLALKALLTHLQRKDLLVYINNMTAHLLQVIKQEERAGQ